MAAEERPRCWRSNEDGVVAQLVERFVRNEEVRGSIPLGSTILSFPAALDHRDKGSRSPTVSIAGEYFPRTAIPLHSARW